jgi:hypothetical protein
MLLNPDPAQRPTAEQALAHSWLTSHAPLTGHDLSGLRENFDPRARRRQAIGAARIVSRLANGAKNKSRPVSSDEESEGNEAQWRQNTATRKHCLGVPSSPGRHKPRLDLAMIAAAAATKKKSSTMSPLSSASIISSPEEVDSETEKPRDASAEDRTQIQTTTLKDVEPCMPGWLDHEVDTGRAAGAVAAADDLDNCHTVTVLGNLWRRKQAEYMIQNQNNASTTPFWLLFVASMIRIYSLFIFFVFSYLVVRFLVLACQSVFCLYG